MKLNFSDCTLDDKGKEDFLAKIDNFHNVFSLRDEIGTCPFIEVSLKLKDENPILCKTISNVGRTKESHTKRNG